MERREKDETKGGITEGRREDRKQKLSSINGVRGI
jgi:hypothetical protein